MMLTKEQIFVHNLCNLIVDLKKDRGRNSTD